MEEVKKTIQRLRDYVDDDRIVGYRPSVLTRPICRSDIILVLKRISELEKRISELEDMVEVARSVRKERIRELEQQLIIKSIEERREEALKIVKKYTEEYKKLEQENARLREEIKELKLRIADMETYLQ